LAYAPKWARDPNRETSHETPQHNEQSVPKEGLISDQARAHRPLDTASLREARFAPRARRPLAKGEVPRSLDPEFLRERPPAPRALGRLAALAGLVIAASIGTALALFVTGKFPSEFNKMLGLSVDTVESRFAGDTIKTPEQLGSPAARPPSASTDPRPIGEDTARAASVRDASERAPSIRG
jgi:hypothetical protein